MNTPSLIVRIGSVHDPGIRIVIGSKILGSSVTSLQDRGGF